MILFKHKINSLLNMLITIYFQNALFCLSCLENFRTFNNSGKKMLTKILKYKKYCKNIVWNNKAKKVGKKDGKMIVQKR